MDDLKWEHKSLQKNLQNEIFLLKEQNQELMGEKNLNLMNREAIEKEMLINFERI